MGKIYRRNGKAECPTRCINKRIETYEAHKRFDKTVSAPGISEIYLLRNKCTTLIININ